MVEFYHEPFFLASYWKKFFAKNSGTAGNTTVFWKEKAFQPKDQQGKRKFR